MNFDDTISYLDTSGIEYVVHEHPPVYTMDAVRELVDLPLSGSVKSMVFETKSGDSTTGEAAQVFVAAVPGLAKVDYAALATACGVKRKQLRTMAAEAVLEALGDIPGSVGPFHKEPVKVIVDTELVNSDRVFCGSGRPDRTIEMSGSDLEKLAAHTAPISA